MVLIRALAFSPASTRRFGAAKIRHVLFQVVEEIKAESVARCNEMYTTSYLSIIYINIYIYAHTDTAL